MYDEQTLKERLREIVANDFQPPTQPEIYPLMLAMSEYIGSPDLELREDLIYMTMAKWATGGVFSAKELLEILKVVLNDQHLFYDIGEQGTDTVFTRTFSLLDIALMLEVHRSSTFIPPAELQVIKQKMLRYLSSEVDFRGYVPIKGWAHAAAHAADVLDEMAQCTYYGQADLLEMLTAIRELIMNPRIVYNWQEDERLVTAVLNIWQRDEIDDTAVEQWLQSLIPDPDNQLPMPQNYQSFMNTKNFLRSLYLRTVRLGNADPSRQIIYETMSNFEQF